MRRRGAVRPAGSPTSARRGAGKSGSFRRVLPAFRREVREPGERLVGDPVPRPTVERPGPGGPIELDRLRVPVEHLPFQPAAAAVDGAPGDGSEQAHADPETAVP